MRREKNSGGRSGRAQATDKQGQESSVACFAQECRRRGVRLTPQRLAVYRTLLADESHPTAEAVYARLRPEMGSLSLATVYRILELLEGQGLVRRVAGSRGVGRFDANTQKHQHLVCRICGRMTDFVADSLTAVSLPATPKHEFLAEELDIRIIGVCAPCRRAGRRRL